MKKKHTHTHTEEKREREKRAFNCIILIECKRRTYDLARPAYIMSTAQLDFYISVEPSLALALSLLFVYLNMNFLFTRFNSGSISNTNRREERINKQQTYYIHN